MLVYGVGILVTVFLSNDATAVVLTPAVYAVAKHAKVPALPYLFICAFIANAASFVLPISNPANLVVFGDQMPRLGTWLREFGLASVVSILSTYVLLRWTQRKDLQAQVATSAEKPELSMGGRIAAGANLVTGLVLLVASLRGWQLGLPTCVAGLAAWLVISGWKRSSPWPVLSHGLVERLALGCRSVCVGPRRRGYRRILAADRAGRSQRATITACNSIAGRSHGRSGIQSHQ